MLSRIKVELLPTIERYLDTGLLLLNAYRNKSMASAKLIPARFLSLTAHFVLNVMLFWSRVSNEWVARWHALFVCCVLISALQVLKVCRLQSVLRY